MTPLRFRKKRPIDRNLDHLGDTSLIVIATEGKKTEKQYFEAFHKKHPRVQVRVLPPEEGESSPRHVLERMVSYHDEFDIGGADEFWLVLDVDRWGSERLAEVSQTALQKGFSMAASNPCFELWLLLHFEDVSEETVTSDDMTARIKNHIGFSKGGNLNRIFSEWPKTRKAIRRAKKLDPRNNERWPNITGTHVYKVMKSILKKMKEKR